VNGEMRQMASTREMVFTIPQLIAFVSSVMTLLPGDVLLTGTPAGVGLLEEGDVVEVDIDGLGVLRNPVRQDASRYS
jgi:2-keto-4-pentenoate hydratase/2-oxohepta-3-ene-1,7-dioic acid hydratase in catechol pathway